MSRQKRKTKQQVQKKQQDTKDKVNRNHKDRLFRFLFQERKDLLELYNAVNQSDYQNPEELVITTLDDVIYVGMKNDVSFIIGVHMNLYEHQSTANPNMPLRGLFYFSRLYEAYLQEIGTDAYGSRKVDLPFPSFVVFYNGEKEEPEQKMLLLSDAFCKPEHGAAVELPALECRATMLNINRGHNLELMKRCQRLWEYSEFIGEIRQNLQAGMDLQEAADTAVEYCMKQGILKGMLNRCRLEVLEMILGEYGTWFHEECLQKEVREAKEEAREAKEEAREAKEALEKIRNEAARTINEAAQTINEAVQTIVEFYREMGLEKEETKQKLMEKFQMDEETAEKYVNK